MIDALLVVEGRGIGGVRVSGRLVAVWASVSTVRIINAVRRIGASRAVGIVCASRVVRASLSDRNPAKQKHADCNGRSQHAPPMTLSVGTASCNLMPLR